MEHILVEHARTYSKSSGFWEKVRELVGNGLVVSEGDFWLRQRWMIQPHFHRQRIAGFAQTMVDATVQSLGEWDQATERKLAMDV